MSLYVVAGYWVNGYTVGEEIYGRCWWLRQRPKDQILKRKVAAIELPELEPDPPPNPQEIPVVHSMVVFGQAPAQLGDPPSIPGVNYSIVR